MKHLKPLNKKAERLEQAVVDQRVDEVVAMQNVALYCND